MVVDKIIVNLMQKSKETRIAKKNKVEVINLPNCKINYIATIIKTMWYWQKNRCTEQQNRRQNPETDP